MGEILLQVTFVSKMIEIGPWLFGNRSVSVPIAVTDLERRSKFSGYLVITHVLFNLGLTNYIIYH